MPPRAKAVSTPVEASDEGDEFETALVESVGSATPVASPYPAQAYRTLRENHSLAVDHLGQIKAYRFSDVLDFAYQMGFVRFGPPEVTVYPGGGLKDGEPIAVVVACAIFTDEDGNETEYYGTGDACPSNCNSRVGQAFVRMAETRAQGRALGRAMNLNALLAEELNDGESTTPARTSQPQQFKGTQPPRSSGAGGGVTKSQMAEMPQYWPPFNNEEGDGFICEITGQELTGKAAFWANDKVGRIVCWDEQQKLLQAKR